MLPTLYRALLWNWEELPPNFTNPLQRMKFTPKCSMNSQMTPPKVQKYSNMLNYSLVRKGLEKEFLLNSSIQLDEERVYLCSRFLCPISTEGRAVARAFLTKIMKMKKSKLNTRLSVYSSSSVIFFFFSASSFYALRGWGLLSGKAVRFVQEINCDVSRWTGT